MAGKTNPADIFTKEDNDVAHYCGLRDLMVVSREKFWNPDSLTDSRWGVLKRAITQRNTICHIPSTKLAAIVHQ